MVDANLNHTANVDEIVADERRRNIGGSSHNPIAAITDRICVVTGRNDRDAIESVLDDLVLVARQDHFVLQVLTREVVDHK